MAGDVLESHISGLAILIPSDISMQDLGLGCAPSGSVVAWQRVFLSKLAALGLGPYLPCDNPPGSVK